MPTPSSSTCPPLSLAVCSAPPSPPVCTAPPCPATCPQTVQCCAALLLLQTAAAWSWPERAVCCGGWAWVAQPAWCVQLGCLAGQLVPGCFGCCKGWTAVARLWLHGLLLIVGWWQYWEVGWWLEAYLACHELLVLLVEEPWPAEKQCTTMSASPGVHCCDVNTGQWRNTIVQLHFLT